MHSLFTQDLISRAFQNKTMVRWFYADTLSSKDSSIGRGANGLLSRHFVEDNEVPKGYDRFARAMSRVLMLDVHAVDPLASTCETYRSMFDMLLSDEDLLCHVPPSFDCMSACLHAGHPVLSMCRADVLTYKEPQTTQVKSMFHGVLSLFFSESKVVEDQVALVIHGFDDGTLHATAYTEDTSQDVVLSCDQLAMLAPS